MAKRLASIVGTYTFSPGASGVGTVTLLGLPTISLEQILLINNATAGVTIYNFNDPSAIGSLSSNILTLQYNTTGMSSGDKLMIWVEFAESAYPSGITMYDQNGVRALFDSTGRQLVSIQAPPAGPGETQVSRSVRGALSGTTDSIYTISSGKTLQIRSLIGGIENTGAGVSITLFEDVNGDLTTLNVIPSGEIIIDGGTQQNNLVQELVYNGVRRLLMRVEILTGGTYRTTATWSGVEI